MNISIYTIVLTLLLWGCGEHLRASSITNIMPGVSYHKGNESLKGKLAFLAQHDYTVATNGPASASLYEFDLARGQLTKLTDCPDGKLICASEGDTFAVIYWMGAWNIGKDTNIFVYSKTLGTTRNADVESSPRGTIVKDGHVLIKLEGYNFPSLGYYLTESNKPTETKLFDYDVGNDQMKVRTFSDAQWQSQHATRFTHKSFDGHYVFFEGKNAPVEGRILVSSPWDVIDLPEHDPKGANIRILHKFPLMSAFRGALELLQLSPDRRYAFVRFIIPITSRKSSEEPGSKRIYYLVDVKTGKTRVLLEENSETLTKGSVSKIWWIQ